MNQKTKGDLFPIYHTPVMVKEVLRDLNIVPGGNYIDCTIGEGGLAIAILEAIYPKGRLLGIDADPLAIERARIRLRSFEKAFILENANFASLDHIAAMHSFPLADGVLFDLGLSALELEGEDRGFSFQREGPLDMRFDPRGTLTANHVVNQYPERELARVLATFGEEFEARRIAHAIVAKRPITSSLELANVVAQTVRAKRRGIHPATKTFQAIRIKVNQELENLEKGLTHGIHLLKPGGRIVVISYHSLEDRIVKRAFKQAASTCICPPSTPVCICGHKQEVRLINRKVITPTVEELHRNPRSRSARLRVAERIVEGGDTPPSARSIKG